MRSSEMEATPQGRAAAWTLGALLLLANLAGYAFDLYGAFWWFDRVLHAGTLFAITLWLALILCAPALNPDRPLIVAALIAGAGVAVGAWWEVAEWALDAVAPGDVIKGKNDTLVDILMDTLGAVLAAALAPRFLRPAPGAGPD